MNTTEHTILKLFFSGYSAGTIINRLIQNTGMNKQKATKLVYETLNEYAMKY
jgi:hypothetical protein